MPLYCSRRLLALTIALAAFADPLAAADVEFEKVSSIHTGNAVLDIGGDGAFDAEWVTCPTVLRIGERYRMWYSSYCSSSPKERPGGIGLAESFDGINWKRLNDGKTVLELGAEDAFDSRQIMGPEVLFDGTTYRMWYTGDSGRTTDKKIVYYQIGLATSADGVTWERGNGGQPVLANGPAGSPDEVQAATPSLLKSDEGYRMWYAAWSPAMNHTICVARSEDGIRWTRENDGRPVEGLSPPIAFGPSVTRVEVKYVMLYMALRATRGLYAAESEDGIRWRMLNDGRPAVLPGDKDDFDRDIAGHPFLLNDSGKLRAWYTGYQINGTDLTKWRLRIGLAEAMLPRAVGSRSDSSDAPREHIVPRD